MDMDEEEADNDTEDNDEEKGEEEDDENTDKEGGEEEDEDGEEEEGNEEDEDEAVESEKETEDGVILSHDEILNITVPCHRDVSVSHVEIHAHQPQASTIMMKSVSQFKLKT